MSNIVLLTDALSYIETNLCTDITADDVARACYCSKSSLQKLFKNVYHYGIKEYVIKRRITRAARDLVNRPEDTVLDIALRYCYSSHEAFTRTFEQIWNCQPSVFRRAYRFTGIHPPLLTPIENGDDYMKQRKHVDITELYDLFLERKNCYFICCDIKSLVPINNISRKAGDLAILETARRMEKYAGQEDVIFRIGGDEFVLLTDQSDIAYAKELTDKIAGDNGQAFQYEEAQVPLSLHVNITKFEGSRLKYDELFTSLHTSIRDNK